MDPPVARRQELQRLSQRLTANTVVAILGPRQVGKTTLAAALAREWGRDVHHFDLERPEDSARLAVPMLALAQLEGLIVIDEVQRRPELFPVLRVLADREPIRARFILLGGAAPELVAWTSESLAGRVAFHELSGFHLDEVGTDRLGDLWLRGGFPRSFLAADDRASADWRRDFVRTFVERDLPQLGMRTPPATISRFWRMLSHYHGQVWNSSGFAASFGVTDHTVRRYLDLLAGTYVVRLLQPWHQNVAKRQVKSPKVYLADSGLLHTLLGLDAHADLEAHPKLGASWEGFLIAEIVRRLGARWDECFFWATHGGAELDLLVVRGRQRRAFEFKRTDAPGITPSMRSVIVSLGLEELDVIHAGAATFPLSPQVRAVAATRILDDVTPLD